MSRPCRECAPLVAAIRRRHREVIASTEGAMQELATRVTVAEAERDDALTRLDEATEQAGRFALERDLAEEELAQARLRLRVGLVSEPGTVPAFAASPPLNERGQV